MTNCQSSKLLSIVVCEDVPGRYVVSLRFRKIVYWACWLSNVKRDLFATASSQLQNPNRSNKLSDADIKKIAELQSNEG